VDFVQLLLDLSAEYYDKVLKFFKLPIKKCPDILIIALATADSKDGEKLLKDIFNQIFPKFIGDQSEDIIVAIWEQNQNLIVDGIYNLYKQDRKKMTFSKIIDLTQNLKDALIVFTQHPDIKFCVRLGLLAGKRDFLHFESWVGERL